MKSRISLYPYIPRPDIDWQPGSSSHFDSDLTSTRATRAVQSGRLRKASGIATSDSSPVLVDEKTIESLQRLHPDGPTNPFPDHIRTQGPRVSEQQIREAVQRLSLDTAGGPSGWSLHLSKTACREKDFVLALVKLANMISQGNAPGARYLLSSNLIPIRKPGTNKLRPIAVGELFYRVVARCIVRNGRTQGDLDINQFGVGSIGGVEPIIWKIQDIIDDCNQQGAVICLDLANAFNSIDRKHLAKAVADLNPKLQLAIGWAYGSQSPLYCRTAAGRIEHRPDSRQGVRQGDPLGPLLFSYAYRSRMENLTSMVSRCNAEVVSYLDDTLIWMPVDRRV